MSTGQQIKQALSALAPSSNDQQNGEQLVDRYEHINLTEAEADEALRLMREQKHFALKRQEYQERINKQNIYKAYTAPQLNEFFKMHFDVDEENEAVISQICKYFAADSEFQGDLTKGLFLMGTVGVGKTTIMEFFKQNQIFSYRMESCRKIEEKISLEGEEYLRTCSYNIQISTNANYFGHQEIGLCFDDLGTEDNSKHYGKERNVMAEIILNRYDNRLPMNSTHITTNLTGKQITERYGTRVTDRIKQMFNIIQFDVNAKSRRS